MDISNLKDIIENEGLFTTARAILHTVFNRLKSDPELYLSLPEHEQSAYTDVLDYCEGIVLNEDPTDGMSEEEETEVYDEQTSEQSHIRPEVLEALGVKPGQKPVL